MLLHGLTNSVSSVPHALQKFPKRTDLCKSFPLSLFVLSIRYFLLGNFFQDKKVAQATLPQIQRDNYLI